MNLQAWARRRWKRLDRQRQGAKRSTAEDAEYTEMKGMLNNREIVEIREKGRETERGPSSSLRSKGG